MGLEMVRVGANQKNIYIELNEVGINRISARPYKVDSDPNGIIWIKYKQPQKKQYISAGDVFDAAMAKQAPEWTYRINVLGGKKEEGRKRDEGRKRKYRDDRREGRDRKGKNNACPNTLKSNLESILHAKNKRGPFGI